MINIIVAWMIQTHRPKRLNLNGTSLNYVTHRFALILRRRRDVLCCPSMNTDCLPQLTWLHPELRIALDRDWWLFTYCGNERTWSWFNHSKCMECCDIWRFIAGLSIEWVTPPETTWRSSFTQELITLHGYTQAQLAKRLGKSTAWFAIVCNY